jgi:hypothetical protein
MSPRWQLSTIKTTFSLSSSCKTMPLTSLVSRQRSLVSPVSWTLGSSSTCNTRVGSLEIACSCWPPISYWGYLFWIIAIFKVFTSVLGPVSSVGSLRHLEKLCWWAISRDCHQILSWHLAPEPEFQVSQMCFRSFCSKLLAYQPVEFSCWSRSQSSLTI